MTLTKGWRFLRNKYYYRVPRGQEHFWDNKQTFKLGDTKEEAYRVWFERTGWVNEGAPTNMNAVFDAFWTEYVLGHLAKGTHESYHYGLKQLRKAFGHMHPAGIKTMHVYAYLDKRSKKTAGNREAAILSSALTFCVEKGWIEANRIRGQINRRAQRIEKPRERVPTREEIEAFTAGTYKSFHRPDLEGSTAYTELPICPPWMRGYIALKMITGLRQGQLLAIDLTEHWEHETKTLHPPTSKGGRDTRYRGPGLDSCIRAILGPDRVPRGPLFVNSKGRRVSATGFRTAWRRAMQHYENLGGARFNEHDIRKYVASEANTLEHAQQLLGHQDPKITQQVYRIGPINVEVLE